MFLLLFIFSTKQVTSEDFCQGESFNASCKQDEFIMITSALYGRMKVCRCLPIDFHTGCSLDVLPQLESRCSGRRRCAVGVADRELFRIQPCRKDLHSYLEVTHKCVKITGVDKLQSPSVGSERSSFGLTQCHGPSHLDQTDGYLSRSFSLDSGLGSENCPWYLEVKAGQKIKFTLINFQSAISDQQTTRTLQDTTRGFFDGEKCASVVLDEVVPERGPERGQSSTRGQKPRHHPRSPSGPSSHPDGTRRARRMAAVHSMKRTEEKARQVFDRWKNRTRSDSKVHFLGLCPGRQSSTLVSSGNKVFAYWVTNRSIIDHTRSASPLNDASEMPIYLKFEAVGCPDVTTPANTWSIRTGDIMVVTCNFTEEKWQFVCEGWSWIGSSINCSSSSSSSSKNEDRALQNADLREVKNIPLGLMLAISVGVIIGIAIGFFFLLLVCLCRRKMGKRRYNNVKVADHEENIYKLIDFHSVPLAPPSSTHSLPTQMRNSSNLALPSSTTPPPFADVIPSLPLHPLPDLQLTSGSTCQSNHVTSSWLDVDSVVEGSGSRGGCVTLGRASGSAGKKFGVASVAGEGSTWTLARPGSKASLHAAQRKRKSSNNNLDLTCSHHFLPPHHQQQQQQQQAQQQQQLQLKNKRVHGPCQVVCNFQRRGSYQTCKRCLECADVQWKNQQMEMIN